jgi:hypothetical protein
LKSVAPEAEILIAADEAAALRRFLQRVREGQIDAAALQAWHQAEELQPLKEIALTPIAALAPLTIHPLGFGLQPEGARQ